MHCLKCGREISSLGETLSQYCTTCSMTTTKNENIVPLRDKKVIDRNYGSTPHLSTSKLYQQADKKIERGQELILTKKARDWKDLIIVTEKIDGSNVGVLKRDGKLIPITRSGYSADTSPHQQHKMFHQYAIDSDAIRKMFEVLPDEWRIAGEWCIQAHGTIYDITTEPHFIVFDIFDNKNRRQCYLDVVKLCARAGLVMVPLLHIGQPITIDRAIKLLGKGHYGCPDIPEGVVYRVEREGRVDFLAKWVHRDKEDGKYLVENQTVWNKE